MENSPNPKGSFVWRRRLAFLIVIATVVGLVYQFARFSLGYLEEEMLVLMLIYAAASFIVALFIYKLPEPKPNLNRSRLGAKIIFAFAGSAVGGAVSFFVGGYLLKSYFFGIHLALWNAYLAFSFVVAPIIGAFIGYFIATRLKDSYFGFESPK